MSVIKPAKEVAVLRVETVQQTQSGLYIPNGDEKFRPEMGIIIAMGDGKCPLECKIGDKVVYRRYTDNLVPIEGANYNFISFKDLMAVISEEVATK